MMLPTPGATVWPITASRSTRASPRITATAPSKYAARDGGELTVDLERCTVTGGNERFAFEIDAFRRECLLEGLDEVGLTIRQGDEIAAYETSHRDGQPWLYSARLDAAA